MAMTLRLTAVGDSIGVILPADLLGRLRVSTGDVLYVIETPDGIRLTPYDAELTAQLDVADEVMRRRRGLLGKLAE